MAISLAKGQKVSLTKEYAGLKRVMVGLGWDKVKPSGLTFGGKVQDIDCDAMAFLLDSSGHIADKEDVVYFGNLQHISGCVTHMGDNLTGEGEGDDEKIIVDLAYLPAQYQRIVIPVSIYKASVRNQQFGMIENAFIRIVDADTKQELCRYNLSENYEGMTAMIFGELYRYKGEWKFGAVGQPLKIWSVAQLAERYGLPRSVWSK